MGATTRRVALLLIAAVLLAAACGAAPAETGGGPTTAAPTIDGTDPTATTPPDDGSDGSGGTTSSSTSDAPGTTRALGTTDASRPGRYVDEVFPEITQVYDDAVFKTAAEAPGFGGKPAKDLLIDVWVPAGDDLATRPLMIFQFGGGFRFGDRNQLAGLAQTAARRGFVAATFDYRTGTGWQDEGLLAGVHDDALDALDWLTARADELGFDPDAVISTGASAGAVNSIHLVTMAPSPDEVPIAGVVSLSGANLTGQAPVAGGPPIVMFSGSQDTIVPFRLQTRFCEQYVAAGNVCEQHVYDAGHMGGDQADIKARSAAFVRDQILRPLGY